MRRGRFSDTEMFPEFVFRAAVWVYEGDSPWYFVTLPADISGEIREATAAERKGFGSLRVSATIGSTRWNTSIFPSKQGPYYLPLKAAVRQREQIHAGLTVEVVLEVLPAAPSRRIQ